MTSKEKIKELESVIDNLLVQSGLSMAKQGALVQMVLGIYRETLDKDKYQSTAIQFIQIWERYSLDVLDGLKECVYDQEIIDRQKLEIHANVEQMKKSFLN